MVRATIAAQARRALLPSHSFLRKTKPSSSLISSIPVASTATTNTRSNSSPAKTQTDAVQQISDKISKSVRPSPLAVNYLLLSLPSYNEYLNMDILETKGKELSEVTQSIVEQLLSGVAQKDESTPLSAILRRSDWNQVGDLVSACERQALVAVPGECWYSLRLDGTAFGKHLKHLKRAGFYTGTYSTDFADIMGECCLALMKKYHGRFGYTQSDEMCILVPPASVIRDEQMCHEHAGRVQKLGTQAASLVTATYNFLLSQKMAERGLDPLTVMTMDMLPTFDCRVGIYPDARAAYALVFWRAYDCSVNSISDAVFHSKVPGFKEMIKLSTKEKLDWLSDKGLLPLPQDQAIGQFYVSVKREKVAYNPREKVNVTCIRGVRERSSHAILELPFLCLNDEDLARSTGILSFFGLDPNAAPNQKTKKPVVNGDRTLPVLGPVTVSPGNKSDVAAVPSPAEPPAKRPAVATAAGKPTATMTTTSPAKQGALHMCGYIVLRVPEGEAGAVGAAAAQPQVLLLTKNGEQAGIEFPRAESQHGEKTDNVAERALKEATALVLGGNVMSVPRNKFLYEEEVSFKVKRDGVAVPVTKLFTLLMGKLKPSVDGDALVLGLDKSKHSGFVWHSVNLPSKEKRVEMVLVEVRKFLKQELSGSTGRGARSRAGAAGVVFKKVKQGNALG